MARNNQILFKDVKLPKGFNFVDMVIYKNLGVIRYSKARRKRRK